MAEAVQAAVCLSRHALSRSEAAIGWEYAGWSERDSSPTCPFEPPKIATRRGFPPEARSRDLSSANVRVRMSGLVQWLGLRLTYARDRFVERCDHLSMRRMIVHRLDVSETPRGRHRQETRHSIAVRSWAVHKPRRSAQRSDGATTAIACLISPLHPGAFIDDQASRNSQHSGCVCWFADW